MKQVDARGYSCPTPVLMVQKEVKASAPQELQVLVDDKCAVENISRFGRSQGYSVDVAADGDDYLLTLRK
ncbi:MAG: sulfurtransferase TusA family protein [Firmicutes bacterium]|nr:sulfurtransferase TusA family protein [Bacillota bacterium]